MAFDRSHLVDNEYNRDLIEKHERVLQEKAILEERRQKALQIGQCLKAKSEEKQTLENELKNLANQSISLIPGKNGELRDAVGTGSGPQLGNSLSWDFEGLNVTDDKTRESDELLQNVIANLEAALNAKTADLERIQKQMTAQAEKPLDDVSRGYTTSNIQNNTMKQIHPMKSGLGDISLSPSTKVRELEHINDLINKRIEELLEQLNEKENEVNRLTKEKEELLQVNHQWDREYRLLRADKDRLANELRNGAGKVRENAQVQQQGPDSAANEEMKRIIRELTQQKDELRQEVARLMEEQKKRDKLWTAAKKMISEEKAAKEAAIQMKLGAEESIRRLEAQIEVEKQTQMFLKQENERLAAGGSGPASTAMPVQSLNEAEQIEMLKQQISVYADDFATERADRERIQADRETLKEQLKQFEREIDLLKEQVRVYRDDFDKERRDKERFQRQLRERNTPQNQQEEPWYMVPPGEYIPMHGGQRRQPAYQDRQYRYTPREIQEIAFQQQQQPMHARGQPPGGGHPGGLCHGCEVDCDVIDGPAVLKCPRCERVFASNERRAFEDHIDKCTT